MIGYQGLVFLQLQPLSSAFIYRIITNMNTLELLKVNRKKQPLFNTNTNSPIQPKVIQKKIPQSRLSYLKKLFSKNMVAQTQPQKLQSMMVQDEMRAFAKSKVTVNSNKNLGKIHLRQIPPYSHSNSPNLKTLSRFNSIQQNIILPQTKLQIYPKSTHVKIVPDTCVLNQTTQFNRTKFIQRHRKITSQGYPATNLNKSAIQSTHQSPTFEKTKMNQSFIEPQKRHLIKREIRELKKIGRMLDDIKCEILKNRSVIIEGMKEIKCVQRRRIKGGEQIEKKKTVDYFSQIVEEFDKLKQNQSYYQTTPQSQQSPSHQPHKSHGHRPKVQYKNGYKIR